MPETVFGLPKNVDLVHQVVISMQSNLERPLLTQKAEGKLGPEARNLGNRKAPDARHGSIRSPIWKGGGVKHGPIKDKNYEKK